MNTLEKLQLELWDYYKDLYGSRPRHWTAEQWADIHFLQTQRKLLDQALANMTNEQKQAEGWRTV